MRRACHHRPPGRVKISGEIANLLQIDPADVEVSNEPPPRWHIERLCRYGECVELLCPVCGCYQGGWGPVDCPCEDWICWLDMRTKSHAPVKPSDRRRPSRRTARRRARTS